MEEGPIGLSFQCSGNRGPSDVAAPAQDRGSVSPYFPYPLSHGGAVRIFHLLREMAEEFDIFLFAFRDQEIAADFAPVLEYCARIILVGKSRYREPRWSTLLAARGP